MFIIIILIVLAGVVYIIMNSLAQNTTTPNITTPFVNPIPNLLLIKDNIDLFYTLNKMKDNADSCVDGDCVNEPGGCVDDDGDC